NSYVGYLQTNKRKIMIYPKSNNVDFSHILRMYFFVFGSFKNLIDDIYSLSNGSFDFDIVSLFLDELHKVIKKGLPTDYRTKIEEIKYASGNVDYVKSYKNMLLGKNDPFVTELDYLSLNTPL